jgi:hypothetical protein
MITIDQESRSRISEKLSGNSSNSTSKKLKIFKKCQEKKSKNQPTKSTCNAETLFHFPSFFDLGKAQTTQLSEKCCFQY